MVEELSITIRAKSNHNILIISLNKILLLMNLYFCKFFIIFYVFGSVFSSADKEGMC